MPDTPDDGLEHVRVLSRLAALAVDESALAEIGRELGNVLTLIDTLTQAPIEGIEPMANPMSSGLRLRDDVVVDGLSRDTLQAPAPAVEDGYFLVPRVIE